MTAQTIADIPPRAINERDRALLIWLAAVKLASESQLARHFWPQTSVASARRRLQQLSDKYRLLAAVAIDPAAMTAGGLAPGPVYELSPLGRDWLGKTAGGEPGYQSKPPQYLHDLLAAEISVRLAEAAHRRGPGWSSDWFGEPVIRPFAPPGLLPDGLGVLRRPDGATELAFFLELDASRESHGRLSSQIGRKIHDYDQYAAAWERHPGPVLLPQFPAVLVVTHGAERLENLAAALRRHRRRAVAYGLALQGDLLAGLDVLSSPAWRLLPADQRQPDLTGQALLPDRAWLTPPARPELFASGTSPAKPAPSTPITSPPPASPPSALTPPPSRLASPPSTTAAPRPASSPSALTPPPSRSTSPPSTTATRRYIYSIPPAPPDRPPVPVGAYSPAVAADLPPPLSTGRKIFWAAFFVVFTIVMMSAKYRVEINHWLNATATPTPTATPYLFEHVPIVTPADLWW